MTKLSPPDINEVLKLKYVFGPNRPLALIPLLVAKKIPAQAWKSAFEDGPWSDDKLKSIWRERGHELNPGIALGPLCGPGLVALDADNAAGLEWLRAHLPPTPMRTLTRHGEHWYLHGECGNRSDILGSKKKFEHDAKEAGFDVRLHPMSSPEEQAGEKARAAQARKDAVAAGVEMGPIVDVRGRGGQVVAPGAIHPSGFRYAMAEPWHADMALPTLDPRVLEGVKWQRPQVGLLDSGMSPMALLAARQREKWLTEARENTTGDEKLRRARAYLSTIEGALGGAGGHDKLFYAACRLVKGFLLSPEDALNLLLSDYNSRCQPEWSYDEIAHKVDDAVKQLGADDGFMLIDTPEWVASQKFWADKEYVAAEELDGPSGDGYEGVSDATLAGVGDDTPTPEAVGENTPPPPSTGVVPYTPSATPVSSTLPADSEDVRQWRALWKAKGVNYDDIGQKWDRRRDGTGKRWVLPPTTNNLVVVLKHNREFAGRLAYNEKDMRAEIDGRELRDSDELVIHGALGLLWNDEIARERSRDAVARVGFEFAYDPWVQFAAGLPAWDGGDHLASFISDVLGFDASVDHDVWQQAYTEWRHQLTGVMARGLVPGTKVHTILIIVGGQGRLKSTLLRELVNGRGQPWDFFTDQGFRLDNKDGQMLIGSYHVCEWGESEHAKNPKAIDTIKAFLAQETDLFRPPWGRHIVKRPRRVVFFGTSNEAAGLLHDTTGHRRFYICNIGGNVLNLNAMHDLRLQLWAQILALRNAHVAAAEARFSDPAAQATYDATRWWYEADEEKARAASLKPYVAENAFQEPIEAWIAGRREPFRVMDVIKECLDIHQGQADMRVRTQVTTALQRLGCTRLEDGRSICVAGRQGRFWKAPEPVDEDQI